MYQWPRNLSAARIPYTVHGHHLFGVILVSAMDQATQWPCSRNGSFAKVPYAFSPPKELCTYCCWKPTNHHLWSTLCPQHGTTLGRLPRYSAIPLVFWILFTLERAMTWPPYPQCLCHLCVGRTERFIHWHNVLHNTALDQCTLFIAREMEIDS